MKIKAYIGVLVGVWVVVLAGVLLVGFSALNTQAQSCSIDNILEQTSVLTVEREIDGCSKVHGEWVETLQAALAADDLSPATEARYAVFLGLTHAARGENYESRQILSNRAVLATRASSDPYLEAFAHYHAGKAFYEVNLFSEGETALGQALVTARNSGNTFTIGRVHLLRGERAYSEERYHDALVELEAALPLLLSNPTISMPEQRLTLSLLTSVYMTYDEFSRAAIFRGMRSSLNESLYADFSNDAQAAECRLTTFAVDNEPLDQILTVEQEVRSCLLQNAVLRETLTQVIAAASPETVPYLQTMEALLLAAGGDTYDSSRAHETLISTARTLNDPALEALNAYYLGRVYLLRNNASAALDYLQTAERIAGQIDDRYTRGRTRLEIWTLPTQYPARLYRRSGNPDRGAGRFASRCNAVTRQPHPDIAPVEPVVCRTG